MYWKPFPAKWKLGLKAPNWRKPPKPKRGRKQQPPRDPNVGGMISLW
jgi:hypothetical protein